MKERCSVGSRYQVGKRQSIVVVSPDSTVAHSGGKYIVSGIDFRPQKEF